MKVVLTQEQKRIKLQIEAGFGFYGGLYRRANKSCKVSVIFGVKEEYYDFTI